MKVYTLLGIEDYKGSELIGVFGSVEDVKQCVQAGAGTWAFGAWPYDGLMYVESQLGQPITDAFEVGVSLEFKRYTGNYY